MRTQRLAQDEGDEGDASAVGGTGAGDGAVFRCCKIGILGFLQDRHNRAQFYFILPTGGQNLF